MGPPLFPADAITAAPPSPLRPPPIGIPETDLTHLVPSDSSESSSPNAWTLAYLVPLLSHKTPPPTHSLKAFELWYRRRLDLCGAASPWSPSRSKALCAMIDLWIRCCAGTTGAAVAERLLANEIVMSLPREPPHILRRAIIDA